MKGVSDYYVGVNGIGASCSQNAKKTNGSELSCKNLDSGSFSVNLKEQIKFIKECSEVKAMVRDNKAPKLMNITTISENAKKKDNGNDGYGDSKGSNDDEDAGAGIGHTNGCKPRIANRELLVKNN